MKTLYVKNLNSFIEMNKDNLLQVEEINEENANEQFEFEYIFGSKEKAKSYLNRIDVDYQEGFFLAKAVQRGDAEMVQALLQRGASEGLKNILEVANFYGYKECAKLLSEHMTKSAWLK